MFSSGCVKERLLGFADIERDLSTTTRDGGKIAPSERDLGYLSEVLAYKAMF